MEISNNNLNDKTALITGGAKRIGKSITLALANAGIKTIIHYNHSEKEANELSEKINSSGNKSYAIQANLQNNNEALSLIENSLKYSNQIDFLINNASIFPASSFDNLSYEELLNTLQVNTFSPLFLSQQFKKYARGNESAIINILDCRINNLDTKHAAYQLSKNMLATITKMMALEYAPNIRVNGIAPGLILPPPFKDKNYIIERYSSNLAKRAGTLNEITSTVLFLLSNQFITGEIINIDGGQIIKGLKYD